MDIVFLIIGLIVGVGVGYLIAGRKSAALSAQLQATREREELLNRTIEERIAREKTITAERLAEQEKSFNLRLAEQQKQWEERLKLQTEEAEALHKRMSTEFENLSNRIFKSKTEDFTKLNSDASQQFTPPIGGKPERFPGKGRTSI